MQRKKIAVVGTGYVGLVTGVALSEIGHKVICVDLDDKKVEQMKEGISPIYEPNLSELMVKNIREDRLDFTTNHKLAFEEVDAIYIAVGTPQKSDGTADLQYIDSVLNKVSEYLKSYAVIVTKSTVPVGTNDYIIDYLRESTGVKCDVVSNPEFLREGSAVYDTFNGDRIVIGSNNDTAASLLEEINKPFNIPVFHTDIRSAELIKYASNAFLATKISFINEISTLCEKLSANIDDVAKGMGQDKRIGSQFLKAGIGYGGSCFPKDTNALVQIAGNVAHEFTLLKAVIEVNAKQQKLLAEKAKDKFGSLKGKKFALLGLAFKPNTDDMRYAASKILAEELILSGAEVNAFDPIAIDKARPLLPEAVNYTEDIEMALKDADAAFIVTEWDEISNINPQLFLDNLKNPIVFDGRNCFDINSMNDKGIEYYSIGRPSSSVINESRLNSSVI